METLDTVAHRLKRLREARGLSKNALGKKAGVDGAYISLIESGKRRDIGISVLARLAGALEVPVTELVPEYTASTRVGGAHHEFREIASEYAPNIEQEEALTILKAAALISPRKRRLILEMLEAEVESQYNRPASEVLGLEIDRREDRDPA